MNIPPLNEQEKFQWESLTRPMLDAYGKLQNGRVVFQFSEREELLPALEPVTRQRMFGLKEPRVIEQTEPPRYVAVFAERILDSRGVLKQAPLELRVGAEAIGRGRALPHTDANLTSLGYLQPDDPEILLEVDTYVLGDECDDPNVIRAAVVRSLQAVGLRPQDVTCEQLG